MTHDEIKSLLAVYALDAVEPEEVELVEAHLRECARCRAEVAEHRETASLLATGHAPAPLRILDSVLDSLEEAPPPPRVGVLPSPAARWRQRFRLAAAAAAAIALIALGVRVIDQDNKINDLQTALEDRSVVAAALAAQGAPGARQVDLKSAAGVVLAHAVLGADGTGYVWTDGLPSVRSGRTYQLWALIGDNKISAGVLGTPSGVAPFRVAADVDGLAITEEAAGGVVETQNAPVAVGLL